MERICTFETSADFHCTTRRYILQVKTFRKNRCENFTILNKHINSLFLRSSPLPYFLSSSHYIISLLFLSLSRFILILFKVWLRTSNPDSGPPNYSLVLKSWSSVDNYDLYKYSCIWQHVTSIGILFALRSQELFVANYFLHLKLLRSFYTYYLRT
jgi:hypothetical protein